MSSSSNHIVILTIFCLSLQLAKTDVLKNYVSRTKNFSDKKVFVDDVGIYKTNLVYAVCKFSEDTTEANCQIKRLTNNQNPEKSCNILIKNQDTAYWILRQVGVMSLNANKAILLWAETNNITSAIFTKFTIVDFNNCHVTNNQIAVDKKLENIPVAVHNNYYDLLISNSELCGDKLCKLSFDFDGNKISGPSPWYSNATEDVAIQLHSTSNGIISASYDLESGRAEISLVQSNDVKILKQYILKSWIPYGWVATFSTDYETIRMCTSENTTVTCQQFDLNGKSIAEHKTDVGYVGYIFNLAVHNLPNGGYVVMTTGCSGNENIFDCPKNEGHYNLTKFNANGSKAGALNISKIKCLGENNHLDMKFFESEMKEPCLSFTCLSKIEGPSNTTQLDFTSKCFSDDEFTYN